MKKVTCIFLVVALFVSVMTACGGNEPVAHSAVEHMIMAMAEENFEEAEKLIYPEGLKKSSSFLDDWGTMCTYVDGSEIKKLQWEEFTVIGNKDEGVDFEESGILNVTMKNGSVFKVKYTYTVYYGASGFVDFYLNYSK